MDKSPEELARLKKERELFLEKQRIAVEFLFCIESAIYGGKKVIHAPAKLDNEIFLAIVNWEKLLKLICLIVECPSCERNKFEYFGRKLYPRLCINCLLRECNSNRIQYKE